MISTISEYQKAAEATDNIPWDKPDGEHVPSLGLMGEVGSLATVAKKYIRDQVAYADYQKDLAEEVGDIAWYLATIASRAGIELCLPAPGEAPLFGSVTEAVEQIYPPVVGIISASTGGVARSGSVECSMKEILGILSYVAGQCGSDLMAILSRSLEKNQCDWKKHAGEPVPPYDSSFGPYERLPRNFEVEFISPSPNSLLLRMHNVSIGDRLTDNSYDDDGYRFHDVFHIANAGLLGWSPVFRRMLKLKRKSDPKKDEVEDGARAAIVEEAVVNHIFNYASSHDFLVGVNRVDQHLIRRIVGLVRGCEVQDRQPWEWQHCIIESYRMFNQLRVLKEGVLAVDAETRTLKLSRLSDRASL